MVPWNEWPNARQGVEVGRKCICRWRSSAPRYLPMQVQCAVIVRCSGGSVTPWPRATRGPVVIGGGGGGGGYRATTLPPYVGPTRLSGAVTTDMMMKMPDIRRAAVGPRRVRQYDITAPVACPRAYN